MNKQVAKQRADGGSVRARLIFEGGKKDIK